MLPASGDDVDDGGLVFISYSHDDVAWAQRFRVLLKPLVRRKQLRLWDDSAIRVGDEWHPAIEQAIDRSRVALVLVSADFLASDYIMERELPALLTRGVMLAPVLVGDCFWSVVPELAAVQWLHDPGRDGPLGLHARSPAERDRRIHRACDRLLTVTPEPALVGAAAPLPPPPVPLPAPTRRPPAPAGPPPAGTPPSRGPRDISPGGPEPGPVPPAGPAVAAVPEGNIAGALFRVPALPPRYVVRDELDGLIDAVVGTTTGGAVGLTGEPAGVGLHGIGGIGKSVLAAALATDDRVRRRFPDGVYWVTVGERPDVLALQLDLLSRLGSRSEARTRADATRALRAALVEKRVLLVVDDVWSADDAQDFRVIGPRGRLLYTSRDRTVVAAAGATAHRVGVLSPTAARALAGEVLGIPAATLPAAADRAFAAVGHVPLAVALLAAAVRGRQQWSTAESGQDGEQTPGLSADSSGRSWERIAADLARDADVYGTHPYATTFRALHIAVAALPADLRAALLGLAVFPPDTAIPVAAIGRYWAHTRHRSDEETAADLDQLVAAEVLQRSGDTIGFHDLAHEYLLLHADALPALHEQLLDAYRRLLDEPDQWWTLPVGEPYVWEHLAAHLAGAGDRDTLVATVTDPPYLACRIARDSPHAGEADLAVAARLLPDYRAIAWWRAWLARHTHLLGGHSASNPQSARVAGTMLAWLEADDSRPAEIHARRLAPLLPRPFLSVQGGLQAESSALIRVLAGHTGSVQSVAWSPDGTRLATASSDNTVRIWDPSTGATLRRLASHAGRVLAVTWSPDGSRLATTGDDATTRVWDSASGTTLRLLGGHAGWVKPVAWSPDGSRLATAGTDGAARISDPATGEILVQLTGHPGEVHAVAWSPDGTRIATAGDDRVVRLWDPVTGERLRALEGHAGGVLAVTWSSNGTRLASTSTDGTCRIWDPEAGRLLVQLTGHGNSVLAASWSPDGTCLATVSSDSTARIWNSVTGQPLRQLTGHSGAVQAIGWSPDGTRLATTGNDGTARIWNPSIGAKTWIDDTGVTTATEWSPDGGRLAAAGDRGIVRISDAVNVTVLADRLSHVLAMAWSPDGEYLAIAEGARTLRLWTAKTGRAVTTSTVIRPGTRTGVRTVAWSPDGRLLATSNSDVVELSDLGLDRRHGRAAPRPLGFLEGHTRPVFALAWSPDGGCIATGSRDRTVRLWDPRTERVVAVMDGHSGTVHAVSWAPDGDRLASTGDDRSLRLWNPGNGKSAGVRNTGHAATVHSVSWSPDGTHLTTADDTGLVIVWDRQLREVASLQLKPSRCLAWSAPLIAVGQPGRPAILALRDPADLSR